MATIAHNLALTRFGGAKHYILPPQNELGLTRLDGVKHCISPPQHELGRTRFGRAALYILPSRNESGLAISYLLKTRYALLYCAFAKRFRRYISPHRKERRLTRFEGVKYYLFTTSKRVRPNYIVPSQNEPCVIISHLPKTSYGVYFATSKRARRNYTVPPQNVSGMLISHLLKSS